MKTQTCEIKEVILEAPDIKTLRMVPVAEEPEKKFVFTPGQFYVVYRLENGKPKESRSYSVSSSPGDHLDVTYKLKGSFTHALWEMKVGDKLAVGGPWGHFVVGEAKDVVLLAGGIGITPFMSMLREAAATNSSTKFTLFYSNRTKEEIAFLEELKRLEKLNQNIKVVFTLTRETPADWAGELGRINETMLKKHLDTLEGKTFFACGPNELVEAMVSLLSALDVPKEKIKFEKFGSGF